MNREIVVDLKEIKERIRKGKKLTLILIIICAIVLDVVSILVDYKNYKKTQPYSEEKLNEYKEALLPLEQQDVEQIFDSYKIYKKQYEALVEYADKSILMKLNTDNIVTVDMNYYVDNHYETVYPIINKLNNTSDIIKAYSSKLLSDETLNKIKETVQLDIDNIYLKELISISGGENDSQTMNIQISADSEELADKIADIIDQSISEYGNDIKETLGEFEIKNTSRVVSASLGQNIITLQQQQINSVNNVKSELENLQTGLSSDELPYYNALVENIKYEKTDFELQIINKKFIILGILLGIICSLGISIFSYCWQNTLRNDGDLTDLYNIYTLGVINKKNNYAIDDIMTELKIFLDKKKIENIILIGSCSEEKLNLIAQKINNYLKEEDRKFDIQCGIRNCSAIDTEHQGLILIEEKNIAKYSDIEKRLELCKKCEFMVLGGIVVK